MKETPLSALQQRYWFLCTAYTGDTSPILFLSWRIRGPLDVEVWSRAVSALVDRHEILRTGFALRDGVPVQVARPPSGIETELIDLSRRPEAEREDEAQRLLAGRTHTLLDLTGGPLVNSCLIRLADNHHVWCFTMHHLLTDGASLRIVRREVRAHYQSILEGTDPELPELTLQYGDFAVQQAGQSLENDLAYWLERLEKVPPLEMPTDYPRPLEKSTSGGEIFHHMPPELAAGVTRLSRTARCTPAMILLAALQAVLAEWSGQDDFCVGTHVAGRTRTELEPLVGLFSNTLALRGDLSGDPPFLELLSRTRGMMIGALKRQGVPFGRVVQALGLPRDPGRTQLFQVIFSMRNDVAARQPQLGELWIEEFPHDRPKILHDLVVDIWRFDDTGIRTGLRYDTALFTSETITALAQRYERLLSAAVATPSARLAELAASGG